MEVNEQKLIAWMEKMEWTPEQIKNALEMIRGNGKAHTIIMPEHYAAEGEIYAEMVCKYEHGLREGTPEYDECFDDAFQHFCFEAWANSTGVDFDSDGAKAGNPTWSKAKDAVSQFLAHGWFGPTFLKDYVKNAGEIKKAIARMKSATMDLTHLALSYRGNMPAHRGKPGEFVQFEMPSAKDKSKEERQKMYAQVTANNLLRSLILIMFMRAAEQIFTVDVDALHNTLSNFVNNASANQKLKQSILNQDWRAGFTKRFDDQFRAFMDRNNMEKFDFGAALTTAIGDIPASIPRGEEAVTRERIAKIEKKRGEKKTESIRERIDAIQPSAERIEKLKKSLQKKDRT